MLSIMDVVELEGLILFRDDEDPQKFYLLPDRPTLSINETGAPDFLFLKFKRIGESAGKDLQGGWIQFRTVLSIDPDRHARAMTGLRALLQSEQAAGRKPFGLAITSTEPVLAAPVWTKGVAHLDTLAVGEKEMVRKATASAEVDLAGALGASMSLQLDEDGAALFWSAWHSPDDQQIPLQVVYELGYRARVSARMEIHAKRTTIEEQLWKRAQPRPYLWFERGMCFRPIPWTQEFDPGALAALQAATPDAHIAALLDLAKFNDTLHASITDGTITCTITTDQTSGDDAKKEQEMLFKVATDVLSGRVMPALFGESPTAQPTASTSDGQKPDGPPLVELKTDKASVTEAQFDITLVSTSTIERSCYPNGALHVLVPDRKKLEGCFREVDLTDSFFDTMDVVITTTGVDFQGEGIAAIQVFTRYEETDEINPLHPTVTHINGGTAVLRAPSDTAHWHFDTVRDAQRMPKRRYQYQTQVSYTDDSINGGRPVVSPFMPSESASLLIRPSGMGAVRVGLTLTAPKEQVKAAHVALRTRNAAGEEVGDSRTLTPDARTATWFQLTGIGGVDQQYQYQVTYDLAPTGQLVMPLSAGRRETLEIPGPFVNVLTFIFHPQGSFDGVQAITLDVLYEDRPHGYTLERAGVTLDKLTATATVDAPVMDGGPTTIAWRNARVTYTSGAQRQLADGSAPAGTVWIGIPVIQYLVVEVRTDLLDFDKDVQLAEVNLSHRDESGQVDASVDLVFTKDARAPQTWRIPLGDGAPATYSYDVSYIALDRTKSTQVHKTDAAGTKLFLDRHA